MTCPCCDGFGETEYRDGYMEGCWWCGCSGEVQPETRDQYLAGRRPVSDLWGEAADASLTDNQRANFRPLRTSARQARTQKGNT